MIHRNKHREEMRRKKRIYQTKEQDKITAKKAK